MKNIVLLVIFVLGIVLFQYIQSQSVDDIINRYLEARGGKDRLNAIRSVYMEGTRELMQTKIPVKITIVKDKLSRTDFEFKGAKGYTMVTPAGGWSFIPGMTQKEEPIPDRELSIMQLQMDIAGPLIDYRAKKHKAELEQKDIINGREAYKIKMTLNSGEEIIYFIDKETSLLIQSKQLSVTDGEEQEIVTNYSDYKFFDDVMFPQTISNPSDGIMGGTTKFETIVLNKTTDGSGYQV